MLLIDDFPVQAEEGNGIRTTNHFEINLQPDMSGLVTYYLEIFFDSGSGVVRSITTGFPFNATEVGLSVAGSVVSPSITNSDGTTTVYYDLGSGAIRPGQSSTLIYTFKVTGIVKAEYNIKYLYIAKPTSDFDIDKMSVEIKYPASFSPPTYTSSLNERPEENSIYLNAANGVLVIWGDEVRYTVSVDSTVSNISEGIGLISLPNSIDGQRTAFSEIESGLQLAADVSGNSYIVLDPLVEDVRVSFQAGVRNKVTISSDTSGLLSNNIPSFDLPADFMGRLVDASLLSEVQQYVVSKLIPDQGAIAKDLAGINNALDLKANPFVYAYLLSAYLNELDIKNEIRYGYLIFPELSGIDTNRPMAWVVAENNGQIFVYDPFLYDLFGYQVGSAGNINRLVMGRWRYGVLHDNALGLLGDTQLQRPSISNETTGINWDETSYTLTLYLPSKAYAGEFYDGQLRVQNTTNYIISPISFTIDDIDHLGFLKLTQDLWKAFPPKSDTPISLPNLREPNFLFDGLKTRVATITASDPLITHKSSSSTLMITVDERLLLIVFFVLLSIWLTIILLYAKNKKLMVLFRRLDIKKYRGAKTGKPAKRSQEPKVHHVRTWK